MVPAEFDDSMLSPESKEFRYHGASMLPHDLDFLRRLTRTLDVILREVEDLLVPGCTTREIDACMQEWADRQEVNCPFLHYRNYPGAVTASINHEVINVPPDDRPLKQGDLLKLQAGVEKFFLHAYQGWTYVIGEKEPPANITRLLRTAQEALSLGVAQCVTGASVRDVAAPMQKRVESEGFCVNRQYVGHGIGRALHELPQIPAYVRPETDALDEELESDSVLALSLIVHAGSDELRTRRMWVTEARDRELSVHLTQMVRVGKSEVEILTPFRTVFPGPE